MYASHRKTNPINPNKYTIIYPPQLRHARSHDSIIKIIIANPMTKDIRIFNHVGHSFAVSCIIFYISTHPKRQSGFQQCPPSGQTLNLPSFFFFFDFGLFIFYAFNLFLNICFKASSPLPILFNICAISTSKSELWI